MKLIFHLSLYFLFVSLSSAKLYISLLSGNVTYLSQEADLGPGVRNEKVSFLKKFI